MISSAIAFVLGVVLSFAIGAVVAWFFGYRDPVDLTTIGAGAATYIVGPVTGAALGAGSGVIALSVGAGLVKSALGHRLRATDLHDQRGHRRVGCHG